MELIKWCIILSSDLHFRVDIREDKKNQVEKIIKMKDEFQIQLVISAGDLTEYGLDGKSFLWCRKNTVDELTHLKNNWVKPIEDVGIKVLMTIGNHDSYTGRPYWIKPVFKYIKNKYGATYYPWLWMDYSGCYTYRHNNVLFISMGIYPKYIKFLKKNLPKDKNYPVIIFYHYNTIEGEGFSDWWSEKQKNKFYETIKDYNIITIINGHIHSTYEKEWMGIKMLNGGGSNLIRMNMINNKLIDVDII